MYCRKKYMRKKYISGLYKPAEIRRDERIKYIYKKVFHKKYFFIRKYFMYYFIRNAKEIY